MADTIASALFGSILKTLTDEAFKKFARSQKIHSELDELQNTLSQIEALLYDASGKEITDVSIGIQKSHKFENIFIGIYWDTEYLEKLPVGIGELRSLHTFTKIIIGGKDGFAINELKGLSNLHGEISIHNANHAQEANLSPRRLTKLELKWSDD